MRLRQFLTTKRGLDRALLWTLPAIVLAAVVGLLFGGPLDNLIVTAWLLPVWLFARKREGLTEQPPTA